MKESNMTLEQIKDLLTNGNGKNISSLIELPCTPNMAKTLLKSCNVMNRSLHKEHVNTLRRDMENGHWYRDIDLIGFDKNGILVNGQHRLAALAGANVESITLKFDFDIEQHPSMDTGESRTYNDMIKMNGKSINMMPNKFKTIIIAGLRFSNENIRPSNSELSEVWNLVKDYALKAESMGLFDLGRAGSITVKASMLWALMCDVSSEKLVHIAHVLKNGIAKEDTDIPIIRLRDELMYMKNSFINSKLRALYTQQCIYDTLRGSTSNRLPSKPQLHYANPIFLIGVSDSLSS